MTNTPDSVHGYQWSGRKAAVAAVLAIGLSGTVGVAAAAALPQGSLQSDTHQPGPGGPGGFRGTPPTFGSPPTPGTPPSNRQ